MRHYYLEKLGGGPEDAEKALARFHMELGDAAPVPVPRGGFWVKTGEFDLGRFEGHPAVYRTRRGLDRVAARADNWWSNDRGVWYVVDADFVPLEAALGVARDKVEEDRPDLGLKRIELMGYRNRREEEADYGEAVWRGPYVDIRVVYAAGSPLRDWRLAGSASARGVVMTAVIDILGQLDRLERLGGPEVRWHDEASCVWEEESDVVVV